MKGKCLGSLYDLKKEEIEQILKASELLKFQLLRGEEHHLLKGLPSAQLQITGTQIKRITSELPHTHFE